MSCTRPTRLSETYQTARKDKPCSAYNATACKPQDNREDILVSQRHGGRLHHPAAEAEAEAEAPKPMTKPKPTPKLKPKPTKPREPKCEARPKQGPRQSPSIAFDVFSILAVFLSLTGARAVGAGSIGAGDLGAGGLGTALTQETRRLWRRRLWRCGLWRRRPWHNLTQEALAPEALAQEALAQEALAQRPLARPWQRPWPWRRKFLMETLAQEKGLKGSAGPSNNFVGSAARCPRKRKRVPGCLKLPLVSSSDSCSRPLDHFHFSCGVLTPPSGDRVVAGGSSQLD